LAYNSNSLTYITENYTEIEYVYTNIQ